MPKAYAMLSVIEQKFCTNKCQSLLANLAVVAGVAVVVALICALPFSGVSPVVGASSSDQVGLTALSQQVNKAAQILPQTPSVQSAAGANVAVAMDADAAGLMQQSAGKHVDGQASRGFTADSPQTVVYLVDVSGSLIDTLPTVVEWMGQTLEHMKADTRFTVVCFRSGEVIEAPPTGLKPASFRARASTWAWLQPTSAHIFPSGRSDISQALTLAMKYDPTQIYILSDDTFCQWSAWGDGPELIDHIAAQVGSKSAKINTVQFFYRGNSGILEAIADRFGGRYTFVPSRYPVAEPTINDLLANYSQMPAAIASR